MAATVVSTGKPASRPVWLVTVALVMAGLLVGFQSNLLIPLMAVLPDELGISVADASNLFTFYLLAGALATPVLSKLADMHGKRLLLVVTLGVALGGEVVAVFSDAYLTLVISRLLAGVGMASVPIAISVMRDELPATRLSFSVGLMSLTLGLGSGVALPLSGMMTGAFGWSSVFVLSAAIAALALLLVLLVVRESPVRLGGRFDVIGSILLTVALGSLLFGVSKINEWGLLGGETLTAAGIVLVAGALWVLVELHAGQPVVDIVSSLRRPVLLTNIATLLFGVSMALNFVTATQELQAPEEAGGFGLDALAAGFVMFPAGLAMVPAALLGGWVMQRLSPRTALVIGGLIMTAAYASRVFIDGSITGIIVGTVLVQVGVGLMFGSTAAMIMQHVPVTETASANGVNALVRAIGNSAGAAITAAIFGMISVTVGSTSWPDGPAMAIMFWLGAGTALLGVIAGLGVRAPHSEAQAGEAGDALEAFEALEAETGAA